MKVWIDQDLCTGDGLCEEIAPDVFVGLDDGLFYVKEGDKVFSEDCMVTFKEIDLDFSQIEDQYLASVNPEQSDETFWDYDLDATYSEIDELAGFCKLLETIEKAFSEYEKFCKKSDEIFDEWHCVLIMYSFMRKYCDKLQINYDLLQKEIFTLQSEMELG